MTKPSEKIIKRAITRNEDKTISVEKHALETYDEATILNIYDGFVTEYANNEQELTEVSKDKEESDDPTWAAKDVEFAKLLERWQAKNSIKGKEKRIEQLRERQDTLKPLIDELKSIVAEIRPDKAIE